MVCSIDRALLFPTSRKRDSTYLTTPVSNDLMERALHFTHLIRSRKTIALVCWNTEHFSVVIPRLHHISIR